MKIKKDDNVIVISGKDRGTQGKVLKALPAKNMVLVEGVNMKKRHQKPRKQGQKSGQVIEKALPIHVSNVMLVDPKKGTRTRVRYEKKGDVKERVAVKSGVKM